MNDLMNKACRRGSRDPCIVINLLANNYKVLHSSQKRKKNFSFSLLSVSWMYLISCNSVIAGDVTILIGHVVSMLTEYPLSWSFVLVDIDLISDLGIIP